MGFCHRCGEITSGRCAKCGGRSVASTISSIVVSEGGISDGSISIVDRWQSQYADTILSLPEEIKINSTKSSPTTKRIPVTQSSFYNPPSSPIISAATSNKKKAVCTCCSKPTISASFVEQGLSYCKECHLKLFNKGECPTCQKIVSPMDSFIEYSSSTWHKECFNCIHCKIPLDSNPLIDLSNQPCCELCFMAQNGSQRGRRRVSVQQQSPLSTLSSQCSAGSFSSQSSISSLGSVTSQLYQSRSTSRRPRIDRDLFQPNRSDKTTNATPPRTPSPTEKNNELYDNKRTYNEKIPTPPRTSTSSPLLINNMMENLSIIKPPSPPPQTTTSKSTKTNSISSRPCHFCHKPLGDSSQKKIKIPLSQDSGEYAWFHKSCFLCSKCHLPFQKNGECATDGHSFYHSNCNVTSVCFGCKKSIGTDAFQFNEKMYHFNCFKCYGNGCTIGIGQLVFEIGKRPFCQACFNLSTSSQASLSQQSVVEEGVSSRGLSKRLGGSKTCPKCQKSISIMDDTPGPLASRWHKKCLVCAKCNKQLDSAAKMKHSASDSNSSALVYCTNCF